GSGSGETLRAPGAVRALVLRWRANSGAQFAVEVSTDLKTWRDAPATIHETSPGYYEATLNPTGGPGAFYRLREVRSAAPTAASRSATRPGTAFQASPDPLSGSQPAARPDRQREPPVGEGRRD
ncbi:MAG: hypothetical protein N3I86_14140, partial [Verrucomicrobiae bacterium]|nr:hypothetical protein [Verrucomicrobiae bacterium]